MKSSGIEWVGQVPKEWEVFPAGGVFSEVKEKNIANSYSNPFSFRYGEIVDKRINGEIDENLEKTLSAYCVVSPNTIMINGLNLNYDFVTQRVAIIKEKGIITSAYLAVKPNERLIFPRFVLYLLKAYDYRQTFHGLGSGIRKTLKYADFKQVKIVAPTLQIQDKIASYLDDFCLDIDTAISEVKASIEEYKTWKASIIDEAVTKGLDPNAIMVDSGVEWLGTVPKSWSTLALKHIVSYNTETLSEDTNPNTEFDYIDIGSVTYGKGIEQYQHMYFKDAPSRARRVVHENDVILSTVRTYLKAVAQIPKSEVPIIVSTGFLVLTANERIDPSYLPFVIQSSPFVSEIEARSVGMSYPAINASEAVSVKVCLPSIAEQKQMAIMLQAKCSKIDAIIDDKNALINDLEAYKKSLIYETVSGKRKVV